MKKTPWFQPNVKPVREGVYETQHGFQWYSPESGQWFGYGYNIDSADDNFGSGYVSMYQCPKWRGLTAQSK
jgi:hypothetical protein